LLTNAPEAQARRGPLAGRLVVAIEHSVAGPLCTRLLHEMGATVVKIERPPHGDFSRHWDSNAHGEGAQFWWLNRGKQSVVLDLKSVEGRSALDQLLGHADVFVQNLSPASAARLGVDKAGMERFPSLVSCHISGYGADGPYSGRKAYDMLIQAEAGVMSLTGTPDQPMRVGVSIADVATGIYGAVTVLGALLDRAQGAGGAALDVAMFDVATEFLGPMLISFLNSQVEYTRAPDQHHAIAPYGLFPCADGKRVLLAVEQEGEWVRFCADVIQRPELAADPRFATNLQRVDAREALIPIISGVTSSLERRVVVERLERAGIAYAVLNDASGVAAHPVTDFRDMVRQSANHAGEPVHHLVGIIERLFDGADGARSRPPVLGEDTQTVLDSLARAATVSENS
jgi:itaconate CoA-transferase